MNKPKILVFLAWYLPGFKSGGPLQSIANLVDHLGDEFEFLIVTRDRDKGDTTHFQNISPGEWNTVGKARVLYLPPNRVNLRSFVHMIRTTPHDVLYLNSFWNPRFTLLPLIARLFCRGVKRPLIIAPRGEFSKAAVSLKAWKKKPYLRSITLSGLLADATWQASSEHEVSDICRETGVDRSQICVAKNLPRRQVALSAEQMHKNREPLQVVFLSRIVPKKNLVGAIEILAQVTESVNFSMYGTIEDKKYWAQCEKALFGLPHNVTARYKGEIEPHRVLEVLQNYDLFLFPTLGENYGHVIAEALQSGLPVLISDRTPWRELTVEGVGADYPLDDTASFVGFIDNLAETSTRERIEMKRHVSSVAPRLIGLEDAIDANRALFSSLLLSPGGRGK